jgi:hypothetical protein
VLLHEGHLWGRKKISIPVSAMTGVENGIRLSLAGVVASPPLGQKALLPPARTLCGGPLCSGPGCTESSAWRSAATSPGWPLTQPSSTPRKWNQLLLISRE